MRYRVKRNCLLFFGSYNKAGINLNYGQIWKYTTKPTEKFPFHGLTRQNVHIELVNEDFERYFEPQTESEVQDADRD